MRKEKKEKDLDRKMNELIKENKSLKKELGKLRKDAIKNENSIILNQEYARQLEVEDKKEKIKKCPHCSGDIKRFKIHHILFEICLRCKNREKVMEEVNKETPNGI